MAKKIHIDLSAKSIDSAIKMLEQYKASLQPKTQQFLKELADVGIQAAKSNTSAVLGQHITYTKQVTTSSGKKCVVKLIGRDDGTMTSTWYVSETQTKTAPVSALLMAEVGSGKYANTTYNIPDSGRGTFPGQTHAWEDRWSYKDETGWHTTSGIQPTYPIHNAALAMRTQIESIAKRVFGT